MIDFYKRNDLTIGNTIREQIFEDKYTFVVKERNLKSFIDYITYA